MNDLALSFGCRALAIFPTCDVPLTGLPNKLKAMAPGPMGRG